VPAPELPAQLGELSISVKGLWLLGDQSVLTDDRRRLLAIVGTREASSYGIRMAQRLAAGAARAGLVVVSGLARGIDAAAHEAAMAAGGRTLAVLGTGVDVPYPAGHRTLHEHVQQNGLVMSEVEPGTKAFAGCFPRRNRIIAGLCGMTLVVEAGYKSGALNTAKVATDLGRTVGVVPGQADDPRAAGSNLLLRDGAQVILTVEDLLVNAGFSTFASPPDSDGDQVSRIEHELWSPVDREILRALGRGASSAAQIAEFARLPIRHVSEGILRLEILGAVEGEQGGYRLAEARKSV
jgi:DNA processing protein